MPTQAEWSDSLAVGRPLSAQRTQLSARLAISSSLVLCVVMPVAMVIANKSAPVALGLGALLANAAVLAAGRQTDLRLRYRAMLRASPSILLMAFIVWCIVSLAWSTAPAMTVRGLSETLPEVVLGWATAAAWPMVATRSHLKLLGLGIAVAGILIGIEAMAGMPLHHLVRARAEPGDLKRSSIPPLLLLWPALLLFRSQAKISVAVLLVASVLFGGVMAHSSATVVAAVVGLTIMALATVAPRPAILGLGMAILFQIAAAPWLGTLMARLLPPDVQQSLTEQHVAQRDLIWRTFESQVWQTPVLGHGFDASFKLADTVVKPQGAFGPAQVAPILGIHPHNQLLQVWIDLGLVGALFVVAALVVLLIRLRRCRPVELSPRLAFLSSAAIVALVGVQAWDAWWLATLAISQVAFAIQDTSDEPAARAG